jgi:uncharacterized protein (DUF924 family)
LLPGHATLVDTMTDIERILSFWMEPRPETADQLSARWKYWFWSGGQDVDRDIRDRFGLLVEHARRGELDGWTATPDGTLALIILIDQFSRERHRFAGRGRARFVSAGSKVPLRCAS